MKIERCAVCDKVRPCEKDHVTPKSCGGIELWPLCTSCHTMVDRIPAHKWDPAEALDGIREFWTKCGPAGRLWMLKMFKVVALAQRQLAALDD